MRINNKIIKKNLTMGIGILMLLGVVIVSILAPWFSLHDPNKVDILHRIESSSATHFLGTDLLGRDIFSRIIFGGRYSLFIGFISIGTSMILGVFFGIIAGYYSGAKISKLIMWSTDIILSFPLIIFGAMVGMIFGPGIRNTILAIAIAFWPRFVRISRAAVLSVKEEVFITAAKSIGMSDFRIFRIHLLPNISSSIIVMAVIWLSDAITVEVALSFIGLGVCPPTPSWGTLLDDNMRFFLMQPMGVIWPCIAIAWTVQALNLIGDRFRDILDPKMR